MKFVILEEKEDVDEHNKIIREMKLNSDAWVISYCSGGGLLPELEFINCTFCKNSMFDEPSSNQSIIEDNDRIINEYQDKLRVLNLYKEGKRSPVKNMVKLSIVLLNFLEKIHFCRVLSAVKYDWYSKNIISSVTLRMNLTSGELDSLFSSGNDRGGTVYLFLRIVIFDQCNYMQYVANLLKVLRRSVDKNKQSVPIYAFCFETDG